MRGKITRAELTFEDLGYALLADGHFAYRAIPVRGLPVSPCQKCRRDTTISSVERKGQWWAYTFRCARCDRKWTITL